MKIEVRRKKSSKNDPKMVKGLCTVVIVVVVAEDWKPVDDVGGLGRG